MDNNTTNGTVPQYEKTLQAGLLACHIVNIVILGLSLYLSTCVATYGWKTGSWRRNISGMDKGTIYSICLVAMMSDLPRLVLGEIAFNVNNIPGAIELCEEIMDATNVAYYIGIFPKYVFLWYRQHTINSHPANLRLFSGKWMKIASYSVLVAMTIILVLVTVFYTTYQFTKSPLGCIFDAFEVPATSIMTDGVARDYIIASGLALIEFTLLFLFVFPLFRSYQSRKKLQRSICDVYRKTPCNPEKRHVDSLTILMKRSTIAATVVVSTDIVVMIIAIYTPPDRPVVFLMVAYNIRNVIHALCVLTSFSLYKQMLTVFCTIKSTESPKRIVVETVMETQRHRY